MATTCHHLSRDKVQFARFVRNRFTQLFRLLILVASICGFSEQAVAGTPMLAGGDLHSAMLDSSGNLFLSGDDSHGQLGQGRRILSTVPLQVAGLASVSKIAGGWEFSVALVQDGTVRAWGKNDGGQLGDGTTKSRSAPVAVVGLTNITAIAAGSSHVLALKSDGTVWAWGRNFPGSLGDGTELSRSAPVQTHNLNDVIAISAGASYSLALKSDGTVWAWGSNNYGQLGNGKNASEKLPVQVTMLSGVTAIAAGTSTSIALKQDGTVWAWGYNYYGQLGDATTTDRNVPTKVSGLGNVTAIGASGWSSAALKQDGSVWMWGNDSAQQATSPMSVSGMPTATAIAVGQGTFALKSDGTVWGRGFNSMYGQLGDGTMVDRYSAVQVVNLNDVKAIAAGQYHILALKHDGTVWAWGSNGFGELGDGSTTNLTTPRRLTQLSKIVSIAAGYSNTLAVTQDGLAWAWGDNRSGQIGDGTRIDRSIPTKVANLSNVISVKVGFLFAVALKQDGTVWGWGDYRTLGFGTPNVYTPIQVPNLTSVTAIEASYGHTLALKQDGTVWAWGSNGSGELGDGTTTARSSPVKVANLTNVVAIATGKAQRSFALTRDGTVWAWGDNSSGTLGDGTITNRSSPVQVADLANVVAIASGGGHSLAIKQDGTVWTWGNNAFGQLGDGTTSTRFTPVRVPSISNASTVAAGNTFSLGLRIDGVMEGWGLNSYGQLGDGTLATRLSPVLVTNETANGPLDLIPEIPNNIPPELIPPFWVNVTKGNDVRTGVAFDPSDLNQSGSVYIVAYLRPDSPLLLPSVNPTSKIAGGLLTKGTGCPTGTAGTVPAVLTRGGWKQTDCITPTLPLYTGTLDTANNTFGMYDSSKFDQTKDNGLFCVAYAGASTTSAKGLIRSVVSGVDANLNICPPIQIGAQTDTTTPSIPLNITATAVGPGQVNLSWIAATDNTAVVRYNIYRGTTMIATLDNVTSYTDTSPQASTAYSYSVMACDAAVNCSGQSTPVQIATPAQPSVILGVGWNLVGNGGSTAMNVQSLFGDSSKIYSLWKWAKTGSTPNITYPNWAFYTPGQADSGAAYAASKGYDTFTSIASGEGFWVNAKLPMSVPMTAPAWILSSVFAPNQSKALTPGWSLIATGEAQTASGFNNAMGSTPPAAGAIPINLTSLWAWQNSAQRWYFYAPSLEVSGGLNVYLQENNYLDLGSVSFAPTSGFWVNRP